MRRYPIRLHGFSLIELMVVVALMAILLSLAVPAINGVISRSTMRGISADFTLAMQRARSEAINRNMCVAVCMSTTANSSAPKCSVSTTSGQNWGVGWIAFELPACGTVTNSKPSSAAEPPETVLFVKEGFSDRFRLNNVASSTNRSVVFNPRGNTVSGATRFNLVDTALSANDVINRTFCLDMAGRIRTLDYASSCS